MPGKQQVVEGVDTPTLCRLVQVAPSTLNYWIEQGVVQPSIAASSGKRFMRWWTIPDVLTVRAVKALREAGCPLQTVAKAKSQIARLGNQTLGEVVLYWDGDDVIELEQWGTLRSAVKHPGQQILHLVAMPVTRWQRELEPEAVPVDLEDIRRRRDSARRPRTQSSPIKRGHEGNG